MELAIDIHANLVYVTESGQRFLHPSQLNNAALQPFLHVIHYSFQLQPWLTGCYPFSVASLDLLPLVTSEEGSSSGDLWTHRSSTEEWVITQITSRYVYIYIEVFAYIYNFSIGCGRIHATISLYTLKFAIVSGRQTSWNSKIIYDPRAFILSMLIRPAWNDQFI